jgi:adenylate kinase
MTAALRALLIAPPGAGKGTQAERICDHFHVTHVSTGEVFRAEMAAGSDLGRVVRGYVERGDLVPDGLVGQIVREQVERAVAETGGYLLDGFPRTLAQAEAARGIAVERGLSAHAVLTFVVPRDVLVSRLLARGGGRSDDNEATILHRLEVYEAETAPLLAYYDARGVLLRVSADRPVDEVTAESIAVLESALAGFAP